MNKKNVLILFGGVSPEHEISKLSADSVLKHLSEEKYLPVPIYITKEGKWLLYDGALDHVKNMAWEKFGTPAVLSPDRTNRGLLRIVGDKVRGIPIDVVFPVLHGQNGEDGTIQGLCALAGLPVVGCGLLSSAISMDKAFTKLVAANIGIAQAEYLVIHDYELDKKMDEICKNIRFKIGYPCFVKPATAGSSIGITKAHNKKDLLKALPLAAEYSSKIVVEKAIAGREIECAVLGGGEDIRTAEIGEILASTDAEFYDFDAKYHNPGSATKIPAAVPKDKAKEIRQAAAEIFKAVDGSGLARVDFFLEEKTNRVIFNEINTVPGFTSISMFAKMWEASGVTWSEILDELIERAITVNE